MLAIRMPSAKGCFFMPLAVTNDDNPAAAVFELDHEASRAIFETGRTLIPSLSAVRGEVNGNI